MQKVMHLLATYVSQSDVKHLGELWVFDHHV